MNYDNEDPRQSAAPGPRRAASGCSANPRLMIGLLMVVGYVVYYFAFTTKFENEFTGRTQHLALETAAEEVAMGLQSAPGMIQEFGGEIADPAAQTLVDKVGMKLVNSSRAANTDYRFDFHLLADSRTINAFALPGGQIFITAALFKLLQSEDQLAGVLGHEIGHVVGRHSNEQMAKSKAISGIFQGIGMAMSDGHSNSSMQMAQQVGALINMKYGRDDENESDSLGVRFLIDAGYDPEAMVGVMEILEKAGGGSRQAEFTSTHPNPGNRIEHIRAEIAKYRTGKK
jgi:predicted Zn-dependent protease